jgi:hypothetical protein
MPRETLECRSLWYQYKTEVWLQESDQTVVVHNVMRVLRAIRNSGALAYVSVPITSGKLLYELQLNHPELSKGQQIKKAIEFNYSSGWNFVEALRKRIVCPIIYPADLVPARQKWEQPHFQALWLSIIAEKCTELHMSEGWEYSNGGTEEFTHAMQLRLGLPKHKDLVFFNTKEDENTERERMRNIQIYDHRGNSLSLADGIKAIKGSSSWLRQNDFEAKTLENCLQLLHWTDKMIGRGFYQ